MLDNLKLHSKDSNLAWIPAVLGRLSSPIHRPEFEVSGRRVSQLDALPWPFVDELVSDPQNTQFRSLERVEMFVEGKVTPRSGSFFKHQDALCLEFKARLPGIERMGLLRCSFVGSLR